MITFTHLEYMRWVDIEFMKSSKRISGASLSRMAEWGFVTIVEENYTLEKRTYASEAADFRELEDSVIAFEMCLGDSTHLKDM